MKKILFIALSVFSFYNVYSQEQNFKREGKIFNLTDVELKPDYPGGADEFFKFVVKNFKVPDEEGLNGKVVSTFVIESDGSLSDIKILQDVGYGSAEEMVRVLLICKKWFPAKLDGEVVRTIYLLPITVRTE